LREWKKEKERPAACSPVRAEEVMRPGRKNKKVGRAGLE
jgi:hypothetical protein